MDEPLVKIVPRGDSVSPNSPFFARQSAFEDAIARGHNLSEYFGLPIRSEAQVYDIHQIRPNGPTEVFVNTIAPTSELGGQVTKPGGAEQLLVPNRRLYGDAVRIGSIGNDLSLHQEMVVARGLGTPIAALSEAAPDRVRTPRIGGATRALGIAGLALEAYDGAQTYRTASRLRGEGNDTAADSELIHFGSRSVGGLGGAAIGAGAGGVATSWSGPGMLVGGAVGGIVGVFGGEKFAEWTDNGRIYNQQDRSGNTWTFDPEQPQGGWRRDAPVDASRALHQATLTDHSVTPRNRRTRNLLGLALKASAVCLSLALSACQQTVSTTAAAPSSQEPVSQTASATDVAQRVSVPRVENWRLSVSPGEDQTYRIRVAGADGREVQAIDGQEGEPPYVAGALLKLDDFTGDGRPDILARGLPVGASALTSERIYVYDAGLGRFRDADPFKNDGEVTKTVAGCIAVEYRNPDNMSYSEDHYCWKKDQWEFQRTTKD
jgi:hypothetical protein